MTRRAAFRRASTDDRGSVLLLTVGFLVVIVMAIGVVVDASSVFLQRRSLAALADGAALAGAQSIDEVAYYRRGAQAALRPSVSQVRADVRDYLRSSGAEREGVRVERIAVERGVVLVSLRRTARAPFTGWLRVDFPVRAEAGARLLVRPPE
jgi:hypothetical protein